MSERQDPWPLLARLSWRFHPRMEEVAVEALAYILNRYPASREGLAEFVERAVKGLSLSDQPFETEVAAPDGTRPDIVHQGDDGTERLFIEAKFFAPLTQNQPVSYLRRLPDQPNTLLVFLAPSERVEELWKELLDRLAGSDMPHSEVAGARSRCVGIEGTGKHLLITDWTKLMDKMEEQLTDSGWGLAELRQLRGLVEIAKSQERKASSGKQLVDRVTESGKAKGWLDTRGLRATPRPYGYGRYANLGQRYRLCVWLGVNRELHEKLASTPLWLQCDTWSARNWQERVRPALKSSMSPHVYEWGSVLWIAVRPEGSKRADDYAVALERIAGIVDELADGDSGL